MTMTQNEQELISMIRGHADPERALTAAVKIITDWLEQHGSSEGPAADGPQGHA